MTPRRVAGGWCIPAAALVMLVLFDLLRVWLPSVIFIVGDAGQTPAPVMGAFALGFLGTGVIGAALLTRLPPRTLWLAGVVLVAVGRLGVQLADGGVLQAATATLGLVGGALAIVALAAGAPSGHAARVGVLAGLAAAVSLHTALGTHDLTWRPGVGPAIAVVLLVGALIAAAVRFAPELDDASTAAAGPAWPWLYVAPTLLLVGIVSGVQARSAIASGWSNEALALALTVAHGLAVAIALVGPRLGPMVTGAGGAALTTVATAIALRPTGSLALVAHLVLPLGIGAVVGALGTLTTVASPRRRGAFAAIMLLVFGVGAFVYYAAYDLILPIPNRMILLAAGLGLALMGLMASYVGRRPVWPAGEALRAATAVAIGTVVLGGLAGLATPRVTTIDASPGAPDAPIRVALYNLQMGYDVQGRFAIDEQAAVLADLSPDIVVLNEVDRGWLLTGGHDTLRLLSARLGLPHAFVPAADEVWGNALLSRYPLSNLSIERLPRGSGPMARSQFAAVLEVADGHQLAVVGTHLSHVDDQGDTRLPQARALAATVARLHRDRGLPTVVLGDLNAEPDSPELTSFQSLVTGAVPPGTATWPSWSPVEQIDHVLVSDDLEVTDVAVPSTQASDHLPIAVTLRFVTDG